MGNFSKIKSPSRADLVVDKITNSIINGELPDGELLPPENKLCELFGVSRSILREAIRVLASKGLVEVRQGYGTLVCVPKIGVSEEAISTYIKTNPHSLTQLMEIRTPIEIEAAKLAAERRQESHLARMEETLRIFYDHSATTEIFAAADNDFHKTIIEASKNPLFGIMIRPIMGYLHLSRQIAIRHFGIAVVIEEHQAVFEAIKKQETTSAAECMRAHMEGALTRIYKVNALLKKEEKDDSLTIDFLS